MMGIVAVGRVSTRILSLFVKNRRMSSLGSSKVSPSPCLVLKPNGRSYKFYSLEKERELDVEVLADETETVKVVGSSYGWVALLNESNNDLYLLDPIHRQRFDLPNISTLPDPDTNLIGGRGSVSKLILSCSPYDYERGAACSVLITYGVGYRLAWCSLSSDNSNRHWVPAGDLSPDTYYGSYSYISHMKLYHDLVYCSGRKLFACLGFPFRIKFDPYFGIAQEEKLNFRSEVEFLQDTPPMWTDIIKPPRSSFNVDEEEDPLPSWIDELSGKEDWPIQTCYLVYAEESDNLYLLVQLFEDSPSVPPLYDSGFSHRTRNLNNDAHLIFKHFKQQRQHYKTAAFIAFKFYKMEGTWEITVVDNLEGLAMFVGANQSFAISPSKFPELNLKPNSVYFTDVNGYRINITYNGDGDGDGDQDVDAGIFDYEKNVILPLQLAHEPFWFTPNN